MAEAIVSTILEQLITTAIENAREEWRLVRGVDREIERLETNFRAIQHLLEDAEEKEYQNKLVKHWLKRFRAVSYDMEDVLDEWNTAIRKLQTEEDPPKSMTNKVCPFVSLSCLSFGSQVVRRHDIASRIKQINQDLEQIAKDKDNLKLIKRKIKPFKRPESTSFVDVTTLHGRDQISEDIVSILLSGSSEQEAVGCCFQTISIIGMGGIGKTALAQLICNDLRVKTHFQHNIIWVCVSDSFDQIQVAKAILGGLHPDSTNPQNLVSLEALLKEISEKIKGKKFFLVLDDVWTDRDQDWEPLKASLQHGKSGSWILVTTRKESVTRQMATGTWKSKFRKPHVFPLDLLSTEICWLILAQKSFAGRSFDSCKRFEDIGREIANKCKGLPLAAKALGGLLQNKMRIEEWQHVLNSEIWKLDFAEEIFAPLLLSYYDLPSAIRQCLLYCAIFPKDFRIGKNKLIYHWMAQRFLNSAESFESELKGEDYFKCLAAYCFFQDFEKYEDGNIMWCKMHDLVHDFVQFLVRSECVAVAEEINLVENLTLGRHLSLEIPRRSQFPTSDAGMKNWRSLVIVDSNRFIPGEVLSNLFNQSKRLRLLEIDLTSPIWMGDASILEIPQEIGKLIHLRYLSLQNCSMHTLPEAVCELWNLQYFYLSNIDGLESLPHGIGKLINLRCLHIQKCPQIRHYPKGIGRLTHLRELHEIIVRINGDYTEEFSIGDLQNLNLLTGNLRLYLRGDAIDKDELERAKLHSKIHLKCIIVRDYSSNIPREDIVEAFNAATNVQVRVPTREQIIKATEKTKIKGKIRLALEVQKMALGFLDDANGDKLQGLSHWRSWPSGW